MSVILFIIGAIAIMAGAAMIGFGMPINEFSFGNTLIASGVTTFMGGLILVGLGAVVSQLQRVAEALASRPPLRAAKPMEPFEAARGAPASRIPFPPKPKAEAPAPEVAPAIHEPAHEMPPEADLAAAPTMRNPDEAAFAEAEAMPSARAGTNGAGPAHQAAEPPLNAGWRAPPPLPPIRAPQTSFFEAMWPASEPRKTPAAAEPKYEAKYEAKPKYEPKGDFKFERPEANPDYKLEAKPELRPELPPSEPPMPPVSEVEVESELAPPPPEEKRAVAILKSGVVDGMGYTLYVDGSIEAELPQGTLRFASINELRSHLEKNS